jgi:hypothetical protein
VEEIIDETVNQIKEDFSQYNESDDELDIIDVEYDSYSNNNNPIQEAEFDNVHDPKINKAE